MIVQQTDDPAWANAIVTGSYTPGDRPLAEAFAENLGLHGVPHVLYGEPAAPGKMAQLPKPSIARKATRDFPGRTIILMDIDCIIGGTILPVLNVTADIALPAGVPSRKCERRQSTRQLALPSTRIIVARPTSAAARLFENWSMLCGDAKLRNLDADDGRLLFMAIGMTPEITVNAIDERYAARDPADAPADGIIIHHSALGNGAAHRNSPAQRQNPPLQIIS